MSASTAARVRSSKTRMGASPQHAVDPREARRRELRRRPLGHRREARGLHREPEIDRLPRGRDDLQGAAASRAGASRSARRDEPSNETAWAGDRRRVGREIVDEPRAPARGGGDGLGEALPGSVRRASARASSGARGGRSIRCASASPGSRAARSSIAGLAASLRCARTSKQPRGGRREEAREVVDLAAIGEVRVVDDHRDGPRRRHAREDLAERGEPDAIELVRIVDAARGRHDLVDRRDAPERREEPEQRVHLRRDERRAILAGRAREEQAAARRRGGAARSASTTASTARRGMLSRAPAAAESTIAPVRLAASAKRSRSAVLPAPAGAPTITAAGLPGATPQSASMSAQSSSCRPAKTRPRRGGARRVARTAPAGTAAAAALRRASAEPAQDLGPVGALLRAAPEQADAELFEVVRRARHERGGAGGLVPLLHGDSSACSQSLERELPGQRLEEHHAERVPVARGGGRPLPLGLLRRHVPGRAEDAVGLPARGHEAEVDHHHAPLARDEDVAPVEIAVDAPRVVERRDAHGEIADRGAQPRLVERARGDSAPDGGG